MTLNSIFFNFKTRKLASNLENDSLQIKTDSGSLEEVLKIFLHEKFMFESYAYVSKTSKIYSKFFDTFDNFDFTYLKHNFTFSY